MNVIFHNRSLREFDGAKQVTLTELLQQSDIVTVHCPLNADSENMFNKVSFALMKQGALFVNTARGGVMQEEDLLSALNSGHLGGACIDTLRVEPMEENCILMQAKTAHCLGACRNTQSADADRCGKYPTVPQRHTAECSQRIMLTYHKHPFSKRAYKGSVKRKDYTRL